MSRIILKNIPAFRAGIDSVKFDFAYNGGRIADTVLKIYQKDNDALKVTSIDSDHGSENYHLLITGLSNLEHGVDYYAVLLVDYYGANNVIIRDANQSNMINVKCLSDPLIEPLFDSTITSSSFDFQFRYSQDDGEMLSQYSIKIIGNDGVETERETYDSGWLYCNAIFLPAYIGFNAYNLKEGSYSVVFAGETINGLSFVVDVANAINIVYASPPKASILTATNNSCNKNIKLEVSYQVMNGSIASGTLPEYTERGDYPYIIKGINIPDDKVVFEDLDFSQEFTIWISGEDVLINNKFLTITGNDGFEMNLSLLYEDVYIVDESQNLGKKAYCILRARDNKAVYVPIENYSSEYLTYTALSNYIDVQPILSDSKLWMPNVYLRIHYVAGKFDIHLEREEENNSG